MLYYLFDYLNAIDFPGAGVFQYISFRTALAISLSLIISLLMGGKLIALLQRMQVKETVRNLGLAGEEKKQGTPTMGGLIILGSILIPTILLTKITNIYIILMIVATFWMGVIGFLDDYIKVFRGNKEGLRGRFKIIGQVGFGLLIGITMYFHPDIYIKENITNTPTTKFYNEIKRYYEPQETTNGTPQLSVHHKEAITNMPFSKNYQFNYAAPLQLLGEGYQKWAFLIYIPIVIFIITAVSNAANLTDGMDGLATGVSAIAVLCLGIFAYLSGNHIVSKYLNILYLPNISELVIFSGAVIGACIGFLWYNAYPAQIFMGDTGSLTLGGIIAALAIAVRKELLIPILCGVFLIENLSVVMQVSYFKYTKKKYGTGKRIFLMSPLHHHYQKKGMHEAKISVRFWIIATLLALITFMTLKLR